MCSRTVSDTANRLLKRTDNEGSPSIVEEKSSAVPYFRSGCRSLVCARLTNKGKVGVQRGRETAGVPSFLPPPWVRRHPRRGRGSPPAHSAERNFPRFRLTTARKSGIIDTQYRKCDEETSFPSAVLQREDIRCKSLSGAENSHFRAVCDKQTVRSPIPDYRDGYGLPIFKSRWYRGSMLSPLKSGRRLFSFSVLFP